MKTILVPIDFSPVTKAVVDEANSLAQCCKGRIVLLYVVQPPVLVAEYGGVIEDVVPLIEAAEKAAVQLLAQWRDYLKEGCVTTKTVKVEGFPSKEIVEQAKTAEADYIVMGSHGHTAFYDLLIGSTTSGVLKKAHCPVVVVPARPSSGPAAK
ncbi:MAG: universal stress protein [Opitutaceae bacterium]|jgi:nucleotide-binding universal stress UspA family protein